MSTLSVTGDRLSLSGPVDTTTVTSLEIKGLSYIEHATVKQLTVDLSNVTEADSSALALMLSWRRLADKMGLNILFKGWSPSLLNLATLCGVDQILVSD